MTSHHEYKQPNSLLSTDNRSCNNRQA